MKSERRKRGSRGEDRKEVGEEESGKIGQEEETDGAYYSEHIHYSAAYVTCTYEEGRNFFIAR